MKLRRFLADNRVELVNEVSLPHLTSFAWELRKFPESVRTYLVKKGAKFRVLTGQGVAEDPEFGFKMTGDGRNWLRVPGAGGRSTSIVANRIREPHGVSIVLHERAHTLDAWGVDGVTPEGYYKISEMPEWISILQTDSAFQEMISTSCGDYCNSKPVEAFAEAFAMYYACENSRARVAKSPRAVQFFEKLVNATK